MKPLIRQAEVNEMPLEPRARFVAIYELVNDRFEHEISKIDGREDWHLVENAQVRLASTMIGFARSLGISEISEADFPRIRNGGPQAFEAFELSLGHVVAQFMTDNAFRAHRDSLELKGSTRDRLRSLTFAMRSHVEHLDLTPQRRDALLRHLDALERDLRNPRLSMLAIAQLIVGVAIVSGEGAQGMVALLELKDRIVETVAQEKEAQDIERDAAFQAIAGSIAAIPVRHLENTTSGFRIEGPTSFAAELDDEIPF